MNHVGSRTPDYKASGLQNKIGGREDFENGELDLEIGEHGTPPDHNFYDSHDSGLQRWFLEVAGPA